MLPLQGYFPSLAFRILWLPSREEEVRRRSGMMLPWHLLVSALLFTWVRTWQFFLSSSAEVRHLSWKLKRKAAMYESRTLRNLVLPLKYLFKGKFMNVFRFTMHNHVWVSKGPTEVRDKSVRSEASGDFVNSSCWNRRLLQFLESSLKAMPLEKSRSYSTFVASEGWGIPAEQCIGAEWASISAVGSVNVWGARSCFCVDSCLQQDQVIHSEPLQPVLRLLWNTVWEIRSRLCSGTTASTQWGKLGLVLCPVISTTHCQS